MEARATIKNVRISPRKVRLVLDLIRNQEVSTALGYLDNTHRSAVPVIRELLKSAVANADDLYGVDVDSLVIREAYANQGTILKRFRARAMGRGARINKRTSHITVVVGES
ncbi:50S ribosomal protein L22 [Deltaproteobacteria bacterium TL4]